MMRKKALDLLAIREHSRQELQQKLEQREYPAEDVDALLTTLAAEGLQSDARFVAMFVRSRVERGYGLLKIESELKERGVVVEEVSAHFAENEYDWPALLRQLWEKKFDSKPRSPAAYAKQYRFLQQRGFESMQVHALLKIVSKENKHEFYDDY